MPLDNHAGDDPRELTRRLKETRALVPVQPGAVLMDLPGLVRPFFGHQYLEFIDKSIAPDNLLFVSIPEVDDQKAPVHFRRPVQDIPIYIATQVLPNAWVRAAETIDLEGAANERASVDRHTLTVFDAVLKPVHCREINVTSQGGVDRGCDSSI
jgi:hypothetical protein